MLPLAVVLRTAAAILLGNSGDDPTTKHRHWQASVGRNVPDESLKSEGSESTAENAPLEICKGCRPALQAYRHNYEHVKEKHIQSIYEHRCSLYYHNGGRQRANCGLSSTFRAC